MRRAYRVDGEMGRGATPELAYTDLLGKTAERLCKLYKLDDVTAGSQS